MREMKTCFILWCKRILKRPLFLFTLLLMPFAVLFLQNCQTKQDSMVRVALYTLDKDSKTADAIIEHFIGLSNSSIAFYEVSSKQEMQDNITKGTTSCGYIFPKNLDDAIIEYTQNHTPFIKTLRPKNDVTTNIVDEIVLSKFYKEISFHILDFFLEEKTGTEPDNILLSELFTKHADSEMLFEFEYADGTKNEILNSSNLNYMLMPMRGIVSVLVLLSCMAGGLLWYSDQKNGLLPLLNQKKQQLFGSLSLWVPGLLAALAGLFTIQLTGIAENPIKESLSMFFYLCSCIGLTTLLRTISQKREYFLATIPFFVIGSLILCPIFIDLSSFLPEISNLNKLLPSTYYLNSLHSIKDSLYLLLYSVVAFAISFAVRKAHALLTR